MSKQIKHSMKKSIWFEVAPSKLGFSLKASEVPKLEPIIEEGEEEEDD